MPERAAYRAAAGNEKAADEVKRMPAWGKPIYARIAIVYASVSLISAAAMLGSDLYVTASGQENLAASAAYIIGSFGLWFAIATQFTRRRLSRIGDVVDGTDAVRLWQALLRLPFAIAILFFAYGMTMSQLFHLTQLWTGTAPQPAVEFVRGLLFGLTSIGGLSLVHYGLLRLVVKRLLPVLPSVDTSGLRFCSLRSPMIAAFVCAVLFVAFRLAGHVIHAASYDMPIGSMDLLIIALLAMLLATAAFVVLNVGFLRELRDTIGKLRQSLMHRGDELLRRHVPVPSLYESGELALAYNELQERRAAEYGKLERQLKIAANVQQLLMPGGITRTKTLSAWGERQEQERVGNRFYDLVVLDEGMIAVMEGYVSGEGMPAALITAACLAAFRAECRAGAGPADVRSRVEAHMRETGDGRRFEVRIGFASADTGRLELAPPLPGGVRTMLLPPGQAVRLPGEPVRGPLGVWLLWAGDGKRGDGDS